jgi:endoglucanase
MRRGLLIVLPLIIFVAVFGLARCGMSLRTDASAQEHNPFADRAAFTWTKTPVAEAAAAADGADQDVLGRMAEVPTAVWLTPESYPTAQVPDFVTRIVKAADKQDRTAVFVIYGITNRDCIDGESSGGLPADQYEDWVARIGEAAGTRSAVILEPDALASAPDCGQLEQRTDLLRTAVDRLVDGGPTVYVDAGHASWTKPADMAAMLKAVGVEKTRGFATNVSGYEADDDEAQYAAQIDAALGGTTHHVTDTGRNGAGSNGEWCNPAGRALGQEPTVGVSDGLDAQLWIKPPGESDGTCGGGPEAGAFWTERALELAANAGW